MRRSIRTLLILAILILLGVGVATVVKRRGNESTTASPTVTTVAPPFATTTRPGAGATTTISRGTTTSSTSTSSTSTTTSTTIAPLTEHPNTGGGVPPLALGLAVLVAGAGGIVVLRCASPSGPTSGRR